MEKFDEKALIQRIKLIRIEFAGERGKSIFARALDISPSTYNYYENDRTPPIDLLLKMANITNCDLAWLLTGEKQENDFPGPNRGLLKMIDELLNSDPALAQPISAFIKLLNQKNGFEKTIKTSFQSQNEDKKSWIPVLGRTAAGIIHCWQDEIKPGSKQATTELNELVEKYIGKPILDSVSTKISIDLNKNNISNAKADLIQINVDKDEQIAEFVQSAEIISKFPDSFALRVDGDSMAPKIKDSDIVVLSPSVPAQQGNIAVTKIAGQIGVTCKLIRFADDNIHLIPINEHYETKIIDKNDLIWSLAVICHISV